MSLKNSTSWFYKRRFNRFRKGYFRNTQQLARRNQFCTAQMGKTKHRKYASTKGKAKNIDRSKLKSIKAYWWSSKTRESKPLAHGVPELWWWPFQWHQLPRQGTLLSPSQVLFALKRHPNSIPISRNKSWPKSIVELRWAAAGFPFFVSLDRQGYYRA